jgi:hypothetical protein
MIGVSIMAIIALVGALAMVTLNTQQTYAITNVGNAGQGRAGGASSGAGEAGGGMYIDRNLFCSTGIITPICKQDSIITPNNAAVAHVSSNTPSNLLHPRPLTNHLSVTMHPTGDSSGSNSSGSSRHHYHNISAYTGSSTSSDSSGSSRHHYHNISYNIIIISHHLHHGKSSGYAGRYGEGPGGSFGEGPGGSFGEGPGGSFGEGPGGSYDGDYP